MEIKNSGWFPVSLKTIVLLMVWLASPEPFASAAEDFIRQWTSSQLLPADRQAEVLAVANEPDGDLVACGSTGSANQRQFFVARYAAETGAIVWQKQSFTNFGPTGAFYTVGTDAAGNVFLTGYGDQQSVAVKLRVEDGAEMWSRTFFRHSGLAVVTPAGDLAFSAQRTYPTNQTPDLWTAVLAGSDGATRWERVFVDPIGLYFEPRKICVDHAGNVVVAGRRTIVSYAGNGDFRWQRAEAVTDLALDPAGNALVLGGSGVLRLASASGAVLWHSTHTFPDASQVSGQRIASDHLGRAILSTSGRLAAPPNDYYAATTLLDAADGGVIWERRAPWSGATILLFDVVQASSGDLWVLEPWAQYTYAGQIAGEMAAVKVRLGDGAVVARHALGFGGDSFASLPFRRTLAVTPDGGIAAAGVGPGPQGADFDFTVVKFVPTTPFVDGTLFSAIGETGATLSGRVNPHGLVTRAYIEYGTTDSYGTVLPVTLASDAGVTSENIRTALTGLAPGTRYHWRLVATNSAGTTTTPDTTFTTLAGPRTATGLIQQWARTAQGTPTASNVAQCVAIAPDGDAVVVGYLTNRSNNLDWYVVKYGLEDGAIRWEQHYDSGSGMADTAGYVGVDAAGDVLVAGQIGNGIRTAKYAGPTGALLWETRIADAEGRKQAAEFGVLDAAGNLLITGTSSDATVVGVATTKVAGSNGAVLWKQFYQRPNSQISYPWKIAVDGQGNSFVVTSLLSGTRMPEGLIVLSYAREDGMLRWSREWSDANPPRLANYGALSVDRFGNVLVAGFAEIDTHHTATYYRAKLAGGDGAVLWSVQESGAESTQHEPSDMGTDEAGNIFISGKLWEQSRPYGPYRDRWTVSKYDGATGNRLWEQLVTPSSIYSHPASLKLNATGQVWLAGFVQNDAYKNKIHSVVLSQQDGTTLGEATYLSGDDSGSDASTHRCLTVTPDGGAVVCGDSYKQENSVSTGRFLAIKYVPAISRVENVELSALNANGVTLRGRVNPHGNATQAYFEYGLTETYGAVAAVTLADGAAMTPQEVGAVVTGLVNHATYHFRLVAWNERGTVVSPDATFFTSAPPQAVDDGIFTLSSSGAATLDVLANDSEPEGESFHLVAVGAPLHGVASLVGSGTTVSYDPADEYAGLDSFTYTVADGHGAAAMATVTVRVPDTRLPVITAMGPFTLYSGLNNLAALPDYLSQVTMTDNVGVTSSAQTPRAGTLLRPGVSTVRLTALDAAGNAGVRDISVIVRKGSGGVETVARTGALLPASLTTGTLAGSRWVSFRTPALSGAGDVAFTAHWAGAAGSGEALFRQDAAGTRFLLRKGQTMRDQARLLAMHPPFFGEDESLLLGVDLPPLLVPGLLSRAVLRFDEVDLAGMFFYRRESEFLANPPGARLERVRYFGTGGTTVFAEGRLSTLFGDPRPTASDDGVLLSFPTAATTLVLLREGDLLFTARGPRKITAFRVLAAMGRMPGGGRTLPPDGGALALVLLEDGSTAIVHARESARSLVLQPGDAVAVDQPGMTWASFSSPAVETADDMAVLGSVTGNGTDTQRVIYAGLPGAPVLVAAEDELAPVGMPGVFYDTLRDPLYRGGTVAFAARLSGNGVRTINAEALLAGAPGALRLVARTGQIAPETGGAVFTAFPALALFHHDWQRALWLGRLAGSGVNETNDLALFSETGAGTSRLLLREGMTLLGRTVKTFDALPTVADSPDAPRTANEAGEVVALVNFTDGTQAVVKVAVP